MFNQYKLDYLAGKIPHDDYNDCRFAPDKVEYAKQWLLKQRPNIRLDDPQTIVDLICKEKISAITAPYAEYALKRNWSDKLQVYDMLKDCHMDEFQVPYVYAAYRDEIEGPDDEMFAAMNEKTTYIIKTNHGSGWNIKYTPGVTDKKMVIEKLNGWLKQNYAYISGYEIQYKWIVPGVICQKLLCDMPLDWSFWCVDGKIKGVGLTKKLSKNFEEYVAFTDENGNKPEWYIGATPEMFELHAAQKKILEQMKPHVKCLAGPHKFVRVDMYYVNGHIYFGEKTFTPCSGILDVTYT